MSPPVRIQGVRPVGNDVPREIKGLLTDMRAAITQLNGEGDLGALRRAQFLAMLRENITRVVTPSSPPSGGSGSVAADPHFNELKRQLERALQDIESMFSMAGQTEVIASQNLIHIQEVEVDLIEQATELADHADELADHAQDLLDLATDIDAISEDLYDPVTGLSATATLLDATIVRVDDTEDSIDVLTAQVTSLEAEIIDTSALDPGIVWQFENDDDGWTSNATLTNNDYFISIDNGASTYFRSPSGIATDGRLFSRIVARIRRVSGTGWLGRASYATSGGGGHGIDTTNFHLTLATEPTFTGGGWVIVVWDMELLTAGGTDWVDSIIDQIQLELSDDSSTEYDVDWVAIGRVAPSFVSGVITALESRVTQTETDITALSASVTALETSVDDLEGDVSANTSAISSLDTRITAAEDTIEVNSTAITSLDSRLDDAESDISAQATAISGLTTSVTSINGTLTSHASQLTSLDSRVDDAESDIAGQATAITGLQTSVTTINGTLTSHSSQLTSLDSRLDDAEFDITANASAISALDTRVDSAEGTITAHSTQLTSLDTRLDDAEADISAQATALSNLDTRVTVTEAGVSASASSITMLQVYSRDANRINPLMTPGNQIDWDFAIADVVSINIGGRNTVAGRIRTSDSVQRLAKFIEIDPAGIYEVRMSVVKNLAHGYLYAGLHSSSDGINDTTAVLPIVNRAVAGGVESNPYWTYQGVQFANHALFTPNQWYDFTFYILGSAASVLDCPAARENSVAMGTGHFQRIADGFRLQPGQRFARLRVLNYYNTTLTDAYFNGFSITRIDNQRTAALVEEAGVRSAADGTLSAERTIKIDVNGYVSGYGLAVVAGASGPVQSSFNVLADRFNFAMPGVIGPTPVFTVGNVNGTPTFGINGNLVVDGTIITRHLIDASVNTSKLAQNSVTRFANGANFNIGMGIGSNVVATMAIDVQDGALGPSPPSILLEVDWYAQIAHIVNQDPTGQFSVALQWAPPGNGFGTAQGPFLPNAFRWQHEEVYPGYARRFAALVTTRGLYQFRIVVTQFGGTGYFIRAAEVHAKATFR